MEAEAGLWSKAVAYFKYVWKAAIAIGVPLLWEGAIQLFDGLQGTVADNSIAMVVVTGILVFLKSNGPKPT